MAMKSKFEKKILQEIHELQESDVVKIFKVVHFIKEELIEKKINGRKEDILRYGGMLKDLTKREIDLFQQATNRRAIFGKRTLSL